MGINAHRKFIDIRFTTHDYHLMNTVREIAAINEEELRLGLTDDRSWHAEYASSAWVYIGGLDLELTEGDVIAVFSQWGEVEDIHLVREEGGAGRSKGFAFLKYEDARSCILAVDNMGGATLLGRTLRVDHKKDYSPPKTKEEHKEDRDSAAAGIARPARAMAPGSAYEKAGVHGEYNISRGMDIYRGGHGGGNGGTTSFAWRAQ